ncbi:hypothetical protein A3D88_03470 [Candidatus Peribacteria bacterium RIFCSPHIGHO2_02_FULL_52_16]|nr:MAG: hypothetical protein A2706_04285 [Candidatus Peribacteria bacterium RIFCSPHIGHO2_01_FULL_51_35]OGJ61746.1 MAG: hypothetical protein A3D88_03470 [Candidatus Peribacteria bacterium RIFCSPHIGHO2_02_FULL_52_16]
MHAFILAGGFATRLWPLTEKRAKPLLPLAGKPILTHLVEKIPHDMPVTVSTNAVFRESFEEWKQSMHRKNLEIIIEDSTHDDHKLGALGATAQWIANDHTNEDILLLTGDNYLGFSMDAFLQSYKEGTPLLAAYDIKDRSKASAFGTVIVDANNPKTIVAFEEKPAQPKTSLVSTGCSILPASTLSIILDFAKKHPDNVGGIFEEFLRQGIGVDCFTFMEPWLDIGSFPAYLDAHRLIVSGKAMVHPQASIKDCSFDGSITVDEGSRIEKSELTDCMIFKNCVIENCTLRNCIVDEGCMLKNIDLIGKMLRTGTALTRS